MHLKSADLTNLCRTAIEAAQKAGKTISEYANKNVEVKNKVAADSLASQVVTEVDVKAQNAILETLSPTLSEYDLALLTEESTDDKSRFQKDYFWCIDPMDGTLAFTEKTPGYAVSIALVSKTGEPVIGVVFDPVTQNLYYAVKNQGAFKNNQFWKPDLSVYNKNAFILHMDRTFLEYENFEIFIYRLEDALAKMNINELHIQKQAGAVLNAIWVLDRAPGCYFKLPKPTPGGGSLWDFAATACIFNETNAYAKSYDNSELDLNRADSSFMNHKGVLFAGSENMAEMIRSLLSSKIF